LHGACFKIRIMFRQEYANLSIFEGLDPQQLGLLSPFMEETRFSRDSGIFDQGQLADCLYILLEGEVIINYKPYDGPPLIVARIIPGGVFGWSSVLNHDQYTSGAVASHDCVAYRIRVESLQHICDCHPDTGRVLLERLAGVIAERMRNTHATILNLLSQGIDANGSCSKKGR
jgi:CRP/FNR family cyclic AMP-dependent transcriptional regulator